MKQIKVCFCLPFGNNWLGGVNYFENLLSAISNHESERIIPIVILPHDASSSIRHTFSSFKVIYTPFLSSNPAFKLLHRLLILIFGRNIFLEKLIKSHGVDILSHVNPVGYKLSVPYLPWIPDFQHLHLPHLFTVRDKKVRDKCMTYWLNRSPFVLLSSNSAAKDMCSWSPSNCHKARVLQFVSAKMLQIIDTSSLNIFSCYGIDKPYFLVPNQYWRHKNHTVLLEALRCFDRLSEEFLVVSTGSTKDYRDPNYFSEFCRTLETENVAGSYRILGEIPYSHLSILMRESLAVINPSLFEGWSTTVEEAKSLGKQIILSDIPVHREQSPSRCLFFDPYDHLKLAEHMAGVVKDFSRDKELRAACEQASMVANSYARFAKKYVDIILECHERFGICSTSNI